MKQGDRVIVIKELYGHGFQIGQKVEIVNVNKSDYTCSDGSLLYLLTSEEFELCEE